MDREAALILAEMSETRAELDRKISRLEARAQEFTPAELTRRYLPEYFVDQAIGGVLTLAGLALAWALYRRRTAYPRRLRTLAAAYARP